MKIGAVDTHSTSLDIQDVATLPLADLREAWAGTLPRLFES